MVWIVDCNIVINLRHILILRRCRHLDLCLSKTFLNWCIFDFINFLRYIYFQSVWMTTWLFPMEQMCVFICTFNGLLWFSFMHCERLHFQYRIFQFNQFNEGNEIRKRNSHYYYMDIGHCTLYTGTCGWVARNGCIFMHKCNFNLVSFIKSRVSIIEWLFHLDLKKRKRSIRMAEMLIFNYMAHLMEHGIIKSGLSITYA